MALKKNLQGQQLKIDSYRRSSVGLEPTKESSLTSLP
jgi:hypothetical protein